ncbi:MAG: DUF1292 domain-containing protein [Clostridia bacterium]|nr:DUF1292 domain-containing protein [Clostridia bacterium]
MAEILNENATPEEEVDIVTLTDENGNEYEFIVLGEAEIEGQVYMALEPVDNPDGEYVVFKKTEAEDGAIDLISIDDDEEFDRVTDFFEDELFGEVDYDAEGEE